MVTYTVVLARDPEGGYVVRVPAPRVCITEGDGLANALHNAREAMLVYLEGLAEDSLPAPPDRAVIELYEDEQEAWAVKVTLAEEIAIA